MLVIIFVPLEYRFAKVGIPFKMTKLNLKYLLFWLLAGDKILFNGLCTYQNT